jgi:hypothetical protein
MLLIYLYILLITAVPHTGPAKTAAEQIGGRWGDTQQQAAPTQAEKDAAGKKDILEVSVCLCVCVSSARARALGWMYRGEVHRRARDRELRWRKRRRGSGRLFVGKVGGDGAAPSCR